MFCIIIIIIISMIKTLAMQKKKHDERNLELYPRLV